MKRSTALELLSYVVVFVATLPFTGQALWKFIVLGVCFGIYGIIHRAADYARTKELGDG